MNFRDRTNEFAVNDIGENRIFSALAYLWILFFIPLVACPNSQYGKFHANQGLILLIATVVLNIAAGIVGAVITFVSLGILGFIAAILSSLVNLVTFVAVVFGIVNCINGKAIELPFIGHITLIK